MGIYKHHKYTFTRPFTHVRHDWSLTCAEGGVNLHVTYDPEKNGRFGELDGEYPVSAGIEFHYASPQGGMAPDHLDCPVTGGRCWHDGSSLYAIEDLWPLAQMWLQQGDHASVFRMLEGVAEERFKGCAS